MGCYDKFKQKWNTVTKVHTGVDDATLDKLQGQLTPLMTKIKQDFDKVPKWLKCTRQMAPDFVAKDPKKMPVWESSAGGSGLLLVAVRASLRISPSIAFTPNGESVVDRHGHTGYSEYRHPALHAWPDDCCPVTALP